jgi:diadenosine tetraphosphate (Ap4A) HIT family hydrolase
LCAEDGGALVWRGARLRVIRANEAGFPAFSRVVWNAHVAEFSDLSAEDRVHCMDAVTVVEQALRQHLAPTKVNLAALGNMVPHLHWHLIPRYREDRHFPQPIWGSARPEIQASPAPAVDDARLAVAIRNAIAEQLAG